MTCPSHTLWFDHPTNIRWTTKVVCAFMIYAVCGFYPTNIVMLGFTTGADIARWYSAGLRAGWSGVLVPAEHGNFALHHPVRLGPTQPPIQWVPGAVSLGVKWPGREADHSPPSSAEVKMRGAIPPLTQYAFFTWCSVKTQGHFSLYLWFDRSVDRVLCEEYTLWSSSLCTSFLHPLMELLGRYYTA
jgi:hypothetical protein